jgi:ubiquinone/menaquinone biosynthesis C-methylase UbiE
MEDHLLKRAKRRSDLQEMLDDPCVPVETRKELLTELDNSNRRFGTYQIFVQRFGQFLEKGALASLRGPCRILEMGSGSGDLVHHISEWAHARGFAFEFHLMDIDPQILAWAQARLAEKEIAVHVHEAGDRHLAQFKDGEFDFVYSMHVLHHIQPYELLKLAMHDAVRVARSGVFMMDFDRRFYGATMARLWNRAHNIDKRIAKDGLISLRRAYSNREVRELCRAFQPTCQVQIDVMWPEPYFVMGVRNQPEAGSACES